MATVLWNIITKVTGAEGARVLSVGAMLGTGEGAKVGAFVTDTEEGAEVGAVMAKGATLGVDVAGAPVGVLETGTVGVASEGLTVGSTVGVPAVGITAEGASEGAAEGADVTA